MNTPPARLGSIFLANEKKLLPALLCFSERIASMMGFSTKASHSIQLALDETCMDVLHNSFEAGEKGEIDVTFFARPDGLEIRVHDMGLPYDPELSPVYDPATGLDNEKLEGIGSYLTKKMIDEYQFNNLGKKGKEVVLIKYFDAVSVVEGSAIQLEPEVVPDNVKPEIAEAQIIFNIRRMKDADALDVCRCIYDCYGYSYANENVYYPDRINALNKSEKLISVVAETAKLEMAGHSALIFYDILPAEVGIVVTKKIFRKHGFARKMCEHLETFASEKNLAGMQIKEVTAHPYTQKFCAKLGFKDCGLLLAHSPKTLSFKGIADTLKQRNSDVLGFKYIETPQAKRVYAPVMHQEMIKKLYNNIGAKVEFKNSSDAPFTAELNNETGNLASPETGSKNKVKTNSQVKNIINPVRSLAEIMVIDSGEDIMPSIYSLMRKILMDEIQVVELYLRLDDPATPIISVELEKMGFIFTGILPETKIGDTMIMQFFNGIFIDYDSIVVITELAKEMLHYVRSNDRHGNL